ncbi:HlyD family type I secretion periplasmic adaptor subunit [Aliivibrio fischeri]|uniref:HlyD family type I secretion periplasmic adaptor subunit n=1 Tax=Aliivibrio fischeri TaxID=668 RepID=UPI0007C51A95|nr:HlyD family type I secretion periplasmic adaptor subunit [Aliivibrio fischeri]
MGNLNKIIESSINKTHTDQINSTNEHINKVTTHKIFIILFLFGLFILIWSSQASIDITVSTRGEALLDSDVEKVQHLEGGILNEVYVSPGELVFKGQKIAQLTSQDRVSELNSTQHEITELQIEQLKYNALIKDSLPDFSAYSHSPELVKAHSLSWEEEDNRNRSNDELILHDITHKQSLISSMQRRVKSSNAQLGLIKEQLKIKQQLYDEDMASYVDVLNMKVQHMNMVREIENLQEAILTERFQLTRLEKLLEDTRKTRRTEYYSTLTDINKALTIKLTQLPTLSDKVDRLLVFSPVDGTVDKVNYNYLSAVISPGDSIADITPLKNKLHAEVKIPRKDVGFIEKGQEVKLKFDAYNFAKYGVITGNISSISRSSYEEKEEEYYLAKIDISQNYLERNGIKYHISPYMEFTADIKTGSRKIIDYALKPVMAALDESFDER